jgi:3-deoxy-7-phosphoheptulonate synthase
MSFTYVREIPPPQEIIAEIPVSPELAGIKKQRDDAIKAIFTGADSRFIAVVGPCSAHDEEAVVNYIARLGRLSEKVGEKVFIIPRIYTNKPRTTGLGYKGMMHQPDHLKSPNIAEGIRAIRRMHIRAFAESGLSAADEMLYPSNHPYLDDVLSYVAVGARSVENQEHRLTASGLDIPVGLKNPTSGDLLVLVNSIVAAQNAHTFKYNGWEVNTNGNPYAHAVMRGSVAANGQPTPNYHYETLANLAELYMERKLLNPSILVDTNHDNSGRKFAEQPRIAGEVLNARIQNPVLKSLIKGLLIESFIEEGNQKPDENTFGRSITDPCLGWQETERLILTIADRS